MAATAVELTQKTGSLPPESVLFGRSEGMKSLRDQVEKVARANVPVLLEGESGTGKDLLAQYIHQRSPWNHAPFVKINCCAVPGSLLESELFGYEKGAFTGANGVKRGRVELADGGTLFLDEISELEFSLQSKLLQFLQDGRFSRIGAQEDRSVDVRLICATNRHLEVEVERGRFRQDLFYRFNVIYLRMPPLRERRMDVPTLSQYFVELFNARYSRQMPRISAATLELLIGHSWPGNIRELENLVKRYVIFGSEDAITSELFTRDANQLPEIPQDGKISLKKVTREAVRNLERQLILRILSENQWNRKRTARALSISYRALLYKLKEAGISTGRRGLEQPAWEEQLDPS